ncbi:MAG: hypothetical protein BWY37_02180 [Firmicutes bacterium ADurb.Bin262]|nr:MAG: hypothetical protein BWY37_02180 [Firmicutes bacterium ADurb.Bin262]
MRTDMSRKILLVRTGGGNQFFGTAVNAHDFSGFVRQYHGLPAVRMVFLPFVDIKLQQVVAVFVHGKQPANQRDSGRRQVCCFVKPRERCQNRQPGNLQGDKHKMQADDTPLVEFDASNGLRDNHRGINDGKTDIQQEDKKQRPFLGGKNPVTVGIDIGSDASVEKMVGRIAQQHQIKRR